ncbi:protein of unknown function DUF1320 [Burkholderia sp. lig30]|jgi:phage gp36-like protein|uniref:gp436 family protein n=1 Tax=Burkholderia sp. lig30 TaxID=1192124 RepID=UPI000461762A|nr:DUF1320 domain-containing protein [Burkholderia sp. lig30]KDB09511.1 protein of unknown function DUF1320 [Burkholderia sp. lig30]
MYATVDQLIRQFGQREVISLSDRENTGEMDVAVLDDALDNASVEIDAYLAGRYTVPLNPAPKLLSTLCGDIARYRLCGGETRMTEEIEKRYKAAIDFLKLVSAGSVMLGASSTGEPVAQPESTIEFASGGRVFGRRDR